MTATSPQALARKAVRRKQRRLQRQALQPVVPVIASPNRKWRKGPAVKMTKAQIYEMFAIAAANTGRL